MGKFFLVFGIAVLLTGCGSGGGAGITSGGGQNSIATGWQFELVWGQYGSGNGNFNHPYGICLKQNGNVLVTDLNNHRVQEFTPNGIYLWQFGTSGTAVGQFNGPVAVTVDSSDNIYVADEFNHRVQKFDSNGTYLAGWGSLGMGDSEFQYPIGIACDENNNVVVLEGNYEDETGHRIQKFTSNGVFLWSHGQRGSDANSFDTPSGIVSGSEEWAVVADTMNSRLKGYRKDENGDTIWTKSLFYRPYGIARDTNGHYYVAESDAGRIRELDSNSNEIDTFGSYGTGDGQFIWPWGVAVGNGCVYVTDPSQNRVQKFVRTR